MAECLVLLLYPAIADIRIRKFHIEPVIATALFFAGTGLIFGQITIADILLGSLPGLAALGISRMTKEALGIGDAVVITALGIISGWKSTCYICLVGLILCAISGLLLIIFKKADRKTALPFIPFLMISVLIVWMLNG